MAMRTHNRTDSARYRLPVPAFYVDANPDIARECSGFDEPWNGWCAPIVDWETVFDLLEEAEWTVRAEGAVIFAASGEDAKEDEITALAPDDGGQYHLRDLGWTFVEARTSEATVLPFARKAERA
jgi:hypothetical protein